MCAAFVDDNLLVQALIAILDHTLKELVFYAIGIFINVTMHDGPRRLIHSQQLIGKLIGVLRDANIEDMDLAKLAAKALHNLAVSSR